MDVQTDTMCISGTSQALMCLAKEIYNCLACKNQVHDFCRLTFSGMQKWMQVGERKARDLNSQCKLVFNCWLSPTGHRPHGLVRPCMHIPSVPVCTDSVTACRGIFARGKV